MVEVQRLHADPTATPSDSERNNRLHGSPAAFRPASADLAIFLECAALTRKRGLAEACARFDPKPKPVAASLCSVEGARSRMRQKLIEAGPSALLDHELVEMLVFLAQPQCDTKSIVRALLGRFGTFADALVAPTRELRQVEGLDDAGIFALRTVHAAALRLTQAPLKQKPILNNWDRLIDYLTVAMAREAVEQFRVIFLDSKNRLISDEAQSRGTVDYAPIYPREIVKRALELHATALILVHNHPSGDRTPSRVDIEMTAEVKQAAAALGIMLYDHLIIGSNSPLSFRREGLL